MSESYLVQYEGADSHRLSRIEAETLFVDLRTEGQVRGDLDQGFEFVADRNGRRTKVRVTPVERETAAGG